VTTSIFPSDTMTEQFLAAQDRESLYVPLHADPDAKYDRLIEIHLSELEPLAACPSSPDNIRPVRELEGVKCNQVLIGSCTNSSLADLTMVAEVLGKAKRIAPMVELAIAPGSRQVLMMLAETGCLTPLLSAGARILESACGPCIGQGLSPANDTVSLRTFNRNFSDRSGTKGDMVYLVSPETAVASAVVGEITDPRNMQQVMGIRYPTVKLPEHYIVDDNLIIAPLPESDANQAQVRRGPTIVVPEAPTALPKDLAGKVLLKCGDKVTTDHIMPAGVHLKHRSNVPEYSKVVFNSFNEEGKPTFAQRAMELKKNGKVGIVVGGLSYGQGSSREHAALCPMYLGVRAVIAKSIERIHRANLINFAIVPLEFAIEGDYDRIRQDDELEIPGLLEAIRSRNQVKVIDRTSGFEFECNLNLSVRDREILLHAGLLSYTRSRAGTA
jgi:aconitate hydratase